MVVAAAEIVVVVAEMVGVVAVDKIELAVVVVGLMVHN